MDVDVQKKGKVRWYVWFDSYLVSEFDTVSTELIGGLSAGLVGGRRGGLVEGAHSSRAAEEPLGQFTRWGIILFCGTLATQYNPMIHMKGK